MNGLDSLKPRYDVVIVGARAAGAATALLLARRGLSVLAVDRDAYGTDTLSTLALMRVGVLQLARWGLVERLKQAGTPAVSRVGFHYQDGNVDVPVAPRDGVPALFAPRRSLLDRLLVDAAVEAGADVRHRTRLSHLILSSSGRVSGVLLAAADGTSRKIHARTVVGADGRDSSVAQLVAAPVTRQGRHATATLYGYWENLPWEGFDWYWGREAGGGALPTNAGRVLVFAGGAAETFKAPMREDAGQAYFQFLAASAPELSAALRDARLSGRIFGFPGRPGLLRKPWGPGWALVGDAGNYKDPITAHGISDALRDAELLASALEQGTDAALAAYEAERDALSVPLFDLSDRIASFAWDTAEVRDLHRRLSDEMKREVKETLARGARPPGLALAS